MDDAGGEDAILSSEGYQDVFHPHTQMSLGEHCLFRWLIDQHSADLYRIGNDTNYFGDDIDKSFVNVTADGDISEWEDLDVAFSFIGNNTNTGLTFDQAGYQNNSDYIFSFLAFDGTYDEAIINTDIISENSPSDVPEPTTLSLLAMSLLLVGRRWR